MIWPMVCSPYLLSVSAVVRPIPGSAVTGRGYNQAAACPVGTQVVSPGADASAAMAASMRLPASPALLSMS
ncbi:hypothetical protein PYK79_32485 [Streptomyces sp. ID05-04B]|nr:hypothetical protein [Streptomyces sp. ID05-04B]